MLVSPETFAALDLRAGTIVRAEVFEGARKPAFKLWVDVGGEVKTSSAQITALYTVDVLVGMQVLCVCNFPPKQIGNFMSEILVCGFYRADGAVVLVVPNMPIENGARLG